MGNTRQDQIDSPVLINKESDSFIAVRNNPLRPRTSSVELESGKHTIHDFNRNFPDDGACLDFIRDALYLDVFPAAVAV